MFKVGDIVEITAESSATGMLDFVKGRGYTVLETACSTTSLTEPVKVYYLKIRVMNESGVKGWYTASHFKLKEEVKVEKKECLFKEGQVVWDLRNGRGVVKEIVDDERYPVIVKFDLKDTEGYEVTDCYTTDGRFAITQNIRSLYFSEPKIEAATEPLFEPVLKQGDVVIAVDNDGWSEVLNVKQELEEQVRNDQGTYFYKEAFTFYRVGEKIKFN